MRAPDDTENGEDDEPETLSLAFYTACYDGNLAEVKRLVADDDLRRQGSADGGGNAAGGETEDEELQIDAEVHGGTAFAAGVQNGHLSIVTYLAELGCDLEKPIHDGATPLFIACYRGYADIVRFLVGKGAKLDTANWKGNTPFFIACQHGKLDIAEVLIEHGAETGPVNLAGSTPFFFACQEGNFEVVKFLVRHGVDTRQGKNGISPFHMSCYRGHLDIVAYLAVEHNFSPNEVDGHGRTPIEVARRAGRDDVLRFLQNVSDADDKGSGGGGSNKSVGSSARSDGAQIVQDDVACAPLCSGDERCVIS